MKFSENSCVKLSGEIIEGFVKSCLAHNFDNVVKTPDCHREWWDLCASDHKFVAIAAPRGHAKSTTITHSYVLASVLFRVHDFVLIISDTETQASQFLGDIKKELQANSNIAELFGTPRFVKYAETDIIVELEDGHLFRIIAKGSNQSLRGLKWNNKRPNLVIGDDLENEEIVMNKDRREKFIRWVYGSLIPILSIDGKMRIIGTILHLDSFLENLMPKPYEVGTEVYPLKTVNFSPKRLWKAAKYKAHPAIGDFSEILWKELWPEQRLRMLQRDYVARGLSDVYSQEMLNVPFDPSKTLFRKNMFIPMREEEKKDIITKALPLSYYIGVDLAVSTKEKADWTVFVVIGKDKDNIIYVLDVIRDRLDTREIIDLIFSLQQKYKPEFFAIEEEKIAKAIGPFLREEMIKRQIFLNIMGFRMSVDKQLRCRSIQGRMSVGSVKFDTEADWYPQFESELLSFPRGQKDDQVDAFSILGLALDKLVEGPTKQEIENEEWTEEYANTYERFSSFHIGRSAITGY